MFRIHPDKNGNISFVAETGQKSEAGMTGFHVTENAIMEPPTYTMVGRLLLNAKPPEPEPKKVIIEVPVEDAILKTYVGKYELMAGVILTISKNDSQLILQITGQEKIPIIPISQNEFVLDGVDDAQITFNKNEAGEVESLTLHQDREYICKKLED